MTQLALRPRVYSGVAELLWEAAGRPDQLTSQDGPDVVAAPRGALCWWCGCPCPTGRGRSVRTAVVSTFPFAHRASAPDSPVVCLPCGWSLCDRISLPARMAADRIRSKAVQGRRQVVSLRGAEPERYLVLELEDGRVGLWVPGAASRDEEPWTASVRELRVEPRDVGPCRLLEIVTYDDLGAGPVEKFRSYHHFGDRSRWFPCTDSDRAALRAWLLDPPRQPWAGVIGDGQKHFVIEAQRADAISHGALQTISYLGLVVRYQPTDLDALIGAIEEMIRAGHHDEDIASGRYRDRGPEAFRAVRRLDPTIAPHRGSAFLDLALYLRRNRKELGC